MLCRDGRARRADPREPVVLVVEDEFLIAMDLELLLGQNGWRVLGPAPTVEVALELLNEEIPDVAILDINVRGKRITAVAEDLRRMGVPFMVASAYNRADIARLVRGPCRRSLGCKALF
jgi:DNA-binding response OmpR family regulator